MEDLDFGDILKDLDIDYIPDIFEFEMPEDEVYTYEYTCDVNEIEEELDGRFSEMFSGGEDLWSKVVEDTYEVVEEDFDKMFNEPIEDDYVPLCSSPFFTSCGKLQLAETLE